MNLMASETGVSGPQTVHRTRRVIHNNKIGKNRSTLGGLYLSLNWVLLGHSAPFDESLIHKEVTYYDTESTGIVATRHTWQVFETCSGRCTSLVTTDLGIMNVFECVCVLCVSSL